MFTLRVSRAYTLCLQTTICPFKLFCLKCSGFYDYCFLNTTIFITHTATAHGCFEVMISRSNLKEGAGGGMLPFLALSLSLFIFPHLEQNKYQAPIEYHPKLEGKEGAMIDECIQKQYSGRLKRLKKKV